VLKNWLIKCELVSPLAGEPPFIDSLLEYELSLRMNCKYVRQMTRDRKLFDIENIPIPIAKKQFGTIEIYQSSDPIIGKTYAEWNEYQSKRFDSDLISIFLNEQYRKSLLVGSGPYKMRYASIRIRLIKNIAWFARCDRKETNKLLKGIKGIGKYRHYGFGLISKWTFKEIEENNSIFSNNKGQKILMKTIPAGEHLKGVKGYRFGFAGSHPPYWHPDNYMKVAIPC
jgi:hypothetical protein